MILTQPPQPLLRILHKKPGWKWRWDGLGKRLWSSPIYQCRAPLSFHTPLSKANGRPSELALWEIIIPCFPMPNVCILLLYYFPKNKNLGITLFIEYIERLYAWANHWILQSRNTLHPIIMYSYVKLCITIHQIICHIILVHTNDK